MENIKLIDCFPYFNEKELLELRIKLLYDHVDKFVITEANQTHSGIDKEFTCHKALQNIQDPLNKIELIQINLQNPDTPNYNHWDRERLQRDAVYQILHKFDDDCLFYFGDCDEILNPEHIQWICNTAKNNPKNILRTPLVFLNCRADLRVLNATNNTFFNWRCPYIASKKHLRKYTPSEIRESLALQETTGMPIEFSNIFLTTNNTECVLGWHFSWMGSNENRKLKCKSYLHNQDYVPGAYSALDSDSMIDFMSIYEAKEGSTDPLGRKDHILVKYDTELLPKIILDDEKLKNFFLPD